MKPLASTHPFLELRRTAILGRVVQFFELKSKNMAVQKNRKTPSKRGMRRSHDGLDKVTLSTDSVTGELHRRHHVTADGYYRGRKVIQDQESET